MMRIKGISRLGGLEMTLFQLMVGVGLVGLAACRATVAGDPDRPIKIEAHVTIDVRQIRQEAQSIEDMVSGAPAQGARKPESRWHDPLVSAAWAQEGGFSPEVMAAIEARKGRFPQLKEYKAQGLVGEDNQGHVAALGGGEEVKAGVEAENRDRETIYQAQLKEKNLPPEAIATIRATFAQEQRERAEPGEKVQLPSGDWISK